MNSITDRGRVVLEYGPSLDIAYLALGEDAATAPAVGTHAWDPADVGIVVADYGADGVLSRVEIHGAASKVPTPCLAKAVLIRDVAQGSQTPDLAVKRSQRLALLDAFAAQAEDVGVIEREEGTFCLLFGSPSVVNDVIRRSTWDRGETGKVSLLLASDGRLLGLEAAPGRGNFPVEVLSADDRD
jgi:hypothetical protein